MNHPKLSESITAIEGGLEEQPRLGTTPSEPSDRSLVQLTIDQLNIERFFGQRGTYHTNSEWKQKGGMCWCCICRGQYPSTPTFTTAVTSALTLR